jgi:hypothetical protein
MAEIEKVKPADVDNVLGQGEEMQETNQALTEGMQKVNMENTLQQGMNNMFNAGIQALSQTIASARDVYSAIGRNM